VAAGLVGVPVVVALTGTQAWALPQLVAGLALAGVSLAGSPPMALVAYTAALLGVLGAAVGNTRGPRVFLVAAAVGAALPLLAPLAEPFAAEDAGGWFFGAAVVYAAYTNDTLPSRVIYTGEPPLPTSVSARDELLPRALRERSSLLRHLEGALLVRRLAPTPDYAFFRGAVEDMAALCAARDVPLVVFAQVPHVAAGLDRADGACADRCRAALAVAVEQERIVRGLGLPVASALPYLRAANVTGFPPANAADWEHPSPAGHRVLGAALADVLTRHATGLPLPAIDPLLAP
jgi:hypothetical protein